MTIIVTIDGNRDFSKPGKQRFLEKPIFGGSAHLLGTFHVTLALCNGLGDQSIGHLYNVLGDDKSTLTSLSLQMNPFGALGFYTIWHGILRSNSRLQNVQLGLRTYSVRGLARGQRDIDMAIRLNQAGRIRLYRDRRATPQHWLECLFTVADDVDCSYTLLREQPALCAFVDPK